MPPSRTPGDGAIVPRRGRPLATEGGAHEALREAAHALMREVGYADITVDEVIRRAGVSRASFYFYFENKKHLLIELARSVMDELYEVAGRHYPDRDQYSRIVLANVSYLDVWRREAAVLGQFFALSLVDREVGEIYGGYRERFEARIRERFMRLLEQQRIPPSNPVLLAGALSSMVEFTAYRHFVLDDSIGLSKVTFAQMVRELSEAWYRAVYGADVPAGYDYTQHD